MNVSRTSITARFTAQRVPPAEGHSAVFGGNRPAASTLSSREKAGRAADNADGVRSPAANVEAAGLICRALQVLIASQPATAASPPNSSA